MTISTSWNPDKEYTGVVNSKGTWKIAVPTPAAGGPYEVTVTANKKKVFQNVFVGEVWLASGQSNMSMPLKGYYCQPVLGSTEAILSSAKKQIHFINIPTLAAYKPLEHFEAEWVKASPENGRNVRLWDGSLQISYSAIWMCRSVLSMPVMEVPTSKHG